ncbi:acyl--CoA ligase [Candidatus Saccharibacteria bacterium]|nr:acyl--CoA ligase [Candidatus Saccharibacteria bacterium]
MLKIKHQKRDPLVPPISVSALFNLSSFGHNDEVVANQKELDFTRRELKQDIKTLAKAFLELGLKKGDIITVATGRSMYENILIFFTANRLGIIVAFLDEKTARDTLLHYLDEFNSPLLITYKATDKRIKDLKHDAKSVKHIINLDGRTVDEAGPDDEQLEDIEFHALDGFLLNGHQPITKIAEKYKGRIPKNTFAANREALISFTSGSTSGPKPMVFTNKALIASAIYSKVASDVKMWDKELHSWMSYVHLDCPYGLVVSVLAPICGGGEVVLTPDIDDTNLDYYIGKNPNTIFGIPPLLEAMPTLKEDTDISDLKMFASGGERLEKSASLAALDFFKSRGLKNIKISNGYGVGEALGLISTAVGNRTYNPDSVGQIPAGVHTMVLDPDTGEELNFGKTGILYVTGKHILSRYYNRPELTDDKIITIHGRRFVKTGDLAYVTETGFITLVGRATFFINNLPAKVYYEVVRAAVSKSELVKKCYVVKGPDPKLKLAAYAFVVTNDGVGHNNDIRQQIIAKASEPFNLGRRRITLKDYELPKKVIFLDNLPLTKANKTDFRKLERMAKELGEINK